MSVSPQEKTLGDGCEILAPILEESGFALTKLVPSGGSGGPSAVAWFSKGDRRLELHFRHSLGLVTYHVGDRFLGHREYVERIGGPGAGAYPGHDDDPLQAFRDLRADLEEYGSDFLIGSAATFEEGFAPDVGTGFGRLGHFDGAD